VMPGASAVGRDVALYIDTTGTARALDAEDDEPGFAEAEDRDFPATAPLALWSPGRQSVRQDDAARLLPAGADVVARVHYKKTWITEYEEFVDQSRLGLYLGDEGDRPIDSLLLSAPERENGLRLAFGQRLEQAASLVGEDKPGDAIAAFAALAAEIGKTPEAAAEGFLRIATEQMASAIKTISVQRGRDPAEYCLTVFGGAGAQFACAVADALGMETCLVHPMASLLSAYGMGLADIRASREQAVEAFRVTEQLSDSERSALMGGTLRQIYNWRPAARS